MNLAENRRTKMFFEVVFEKNRLHVVHDPIYSASCYCYFEIVYGYSAKQIITCPVTPCIEALN